MSNEDDAAAPGRAFNWGRIRRLRSELEESKRRGLAPFESRGQTAQFFREMVSALGGSRNAALLEEYRAAGERLFAAVEQVEANNDRGIVDTRIRDEMNDAMEQFERVSGRVDNWFRRLSGDEQ